MNKIALLNDAFRRTFSGGKVTMTAGVYALPDVVKAAALQKAATFDQFTEDNDPHGEHDFGSFELCGRYPTLPFGARKSEEVPTAVLVPLKYASCP